MGFHRFVTIRGQRFDITNTPVIDERDCDRCGSFVRHRTRVTLPTELVAEIPADTLVDICDQCVTLYFPGLVDLAHKVNARD